MKELESYPMHRRDFLTVGAAGLTSLLASAVAPASAAQADRKRLPGKTGPVSVGYWEESDRLPELDWHTAERGLDPEAGPRIIPASSLRDGDALFEKVGLWVTIHGLFPVPELADLVPRASILFDVLFQPKDNIAYRAWNLRGGPNPSPSPPVKFFAPVEEKSRSLLFRGELQGYGTGMSQPGGTPPRVKPRAGAKKPPKAPPLKLYRRLFDARLAVASEKDIPKLVRGFYLIGLPSTVDGQPPDWNAWPLDLSGNEFSTLLISIEHGNAPK